MAGPTFNSILGQLSRALTAFQSANASFQVVRTVSAPLRQDGHPKTLLILDSSFNPPSRAHLTLLKSALRKDVPGSCAGPLRLLLLFSTHNADKAPSAASFDQRLALMTVFAEDLMDDLTSSSEYNTPDVDIGLTSSPYYTDKSKAIAEDGKDTYPGSPRHIHIMGFDTITRFLAPKYYNEFDPPLSALDPYFDAGHELRVTLRPSEDFGTIEDQRAFIASLEQGDLEAVGGKRAWAKQITTVQAGDGVGVSSTRARKAAKARDWSQVKQLCTPTVAAVVEQERVYEGDDRGAKMA